MACFPENPPLELQQEASQEGSKFKFSKTTAAKSAVTHVYHRVFFAIRID
jgi:hypothetical protein